MTAFPDYYGYARSFDPRERDYLQNRIRDLEIENSRLQHSHHGSLAFDSGEAISKINEKNSKEKKADSNTLLLLIP